MGNDPIWEVLIIFGLPVALILVLGMVLPPTLWEAVIYGLGIVLLYCILMILVMALVTYVSRPPSNDNTTDFWK